MTKWRGGRTTTWGWAALGWSILGWGGLAGAADASGGFCSAAGGTLGSNMYVSPSAINGSFGTAANSWSSGQKPTWGDPLPVGVTTLKYINDKTPLDPKKPWLVAGAPENGEYTISNTTKLRKDDNWWTSPDHTTGDYKGMMMVINADSNPATFLHQNFPVTPNRTYEFGLWVMNILRQANNNSPISPNIRVDLIRKKGETVISTETIASTGDVLMTTPTSSSQVVGGVWKSYGNIVNAGDADNVDIDFVNNVKGGEGNDLAIDDLVFAPCTIGNLDTLAGTVYLDKDNNNQYASSKDMAIGSVSVELVTAGGTIFNTVTTDANGNYKFTDVPPATYTVRVKATNPAILPSYYATAPSSASQTVTLASGENRTGVNFGYQQRLTDLNVSKTQSLTNGNFKSDDITQDMGVTFYYSLTLTNAGPLTAHGAVMTDTVPAELSSVQLVKTTPGGNANCASDLTGNALTVTATMLPIGGSCQVTLSAKSVVKGTFFNSANVTPPSTVADLDTTNNKAGPVKVTILDKPTVNLTKKVRTLGPPTNLNLKATFGDTSNALPGDVVEYCITASNVAGVSAAQNVTINDPLASTLKAWLDGYGAGQGIQLQRTIGGTAASPTTLSSAADTDAGTLTALPAGGGNLTVKVGTVNSGDSARVCFRAQVP